MKNSNIKIKFLVYLILILSFCARKADLQIGIEAVKKGEYVKAVKALKNTLIKDSLNPEVRFNLSLAYAHLDSANQSFKHYLKLDELGSNLKDSSQLKEIIASILQLELYPTSPIPMKKMNQFKGSPRPDGELIAVAAAKLDVADIYLIKLDGTIVKKITSGRMNTDPDFSPNGDKVVYVSDRDGDEELYLYDLKTEKTEKLTDNNFLDFLPSFAPSGKEIVFVSNMDKGWEIYKINITSKKILRLTNNKVWDGFPRFTPDGKWILFSSKRNGSEDIYIMNENGGGEKLLYSTTADENDPSMVNNNLFFKSTRNGEWELYRLNVKTRALTRLTFNKYPDWNIRVTKDGTKILASRKIKNRWELYFMNLSITIPSGIIIKAIKEKGI